MIDPTAPLPRRAFLVGAAGAGGALALAAAGCAPITAPSADPVVEAAWALALRDADVLGDAASSAAETRAAQADALAAEVSRSCGVLEDGSSPEECVAAPSPLPAAPSPSEPVAVLAESRGSGLLYDALGSGRALQDPYEAALVSAVDGGIVLALRGLGTEWADLVPELAGGGDNEEDGVLDADDAAPFADALIAEYALIYGMGVAAPRIGGELRQSTATSADRHRMLRDRVISLVEDAGADVPVAEPGYAVVDGAPDPESDAAGFAAALEDSCAQAWRQALLDAKKPAARAFALHAAGMCHAGGSVFRGDGAAALPGLPG
ncbi:DUF4439 domain-containing protein [Corynebacterium sp. NPDC060344]|uniref:DUF4439 domain-containing protein n=1 Tax=Corynebacterium sp. NPDC060344 TaxID=3347101 RepID=UPI0036525ED9